MKPLSQQELRQLPAVIDLLTAARAFQIGRTKAYELARDDQFPCPVIRCGHAYRVSTAHIHQLLGIDTPETISA